jgi:hypothetical protein
VAEEKPHISAPLTGLASPLVKYNWGPEQQKAIKQKVSQETLLAFPDFEK